MAHQYFVDRAGKLSNVRRTATGGMLVDATLAKVGVMDYWTDPKKNPDKLMVRRYNPAAVLSAHAADVATAPVTRLHPAKFVDVHNYQALAMGHVVGTPTFKDGHIHATLAIQDAKLIRDIDLGVMSEVSMGYAAYHDGTPGTTEDGQMYDEARVRIEWNHIAIVPAGRAGKSVRLMLDSEDIPQNEEDESTMKIVINGVEVDATSAQGAFDSYDAGLQVKLADLVKERDALALQVKELDAKLAVAQSDETIDAAVQARLDKQAAQKAADEKLARVKAAYPSVNFDGRGAEFIDAFDMRIEADKAKDPSGLGKLDGTANAAAGVKPAVKSTDAKVKPKKDPRAEMRAYNAKLSRSPVGEKGIPDPKQAARDEAPAE